MIFELHFGSVYLSMYLAMYRLDFESAGILSLARILSLALMNKKIEKLSYLDTREAFFIRSINFERAGILSLALVNKN